MTTNMARYLAHRLTAAGRPVPAEATAIYAAIAAWYREAGSSRELTRALGVSRITVTAYARRGGARIRKPGGCQFAVPPVTLGGETHSWRDWLPPEAWTPQERQILKQRLQRGWTVERALSTPIAPRRHAA